MTVATNGRRLTQEPLVVIQTVQRWFTVIGVRVGLIVLVLLMMLLLVLMGRIIVHVVISARMVMRAAVQP
jgi:hypothetical protein